MNDQSQGDEPDDETLPDAHIRALLAELGSGPDGDPMPPEIAARLDDTLARLVAERGPGGSGDAVDEELPDNVVPLRRTWLPRLTVAAAAVVVLGAGGVAASNLGLFGNQADTMAGSGDSASSETAGGASTLSPDTPSSGLTRDGIVTAGELPRLRSASFGSDVESLLSRRAPAAGTPVPSAPDSGAEGKSPTPRNGDTTDSSKALRSQACRGPRITDGATTSPVRYDGRLAVLVVHPEQGGQRLVEAWDCAGEQRLAETTLTP